MSEHVWSHLWLYVVPVWTQWKCVTGALKPFLFDCANMFSTDSVFPPCPDRPLLPYAPPSLPFHCNVISLSPSISLTMSAALVHPSCILPFSTSALSFAGVISIQGCFAAIWNAFSTLPYGLFFVAGKAYKLQNSLVPLKPSASFPYSLRASLVWSITLNNRHQNLSLFTCQQIN